MPKPAVVRLPLLSPWEAHVRRWEHCQKCDLHSCRTEIVLFRGRLPCDLLFVGEAPGRTEDALGEPFKGPAGQLLDRIVEGALDPLDLPAPPRLGFCNLIACIPLDDGGDKVGDPPDEAVNACAPRVVELVLMARPRLIVRVGKHAQYWLDPAYRGTIRLPWTAPFCDLYHPAWMLRKPDAFRDVEAQRASVILRDAVDKAMSGDAPKMTAVKKPPEPPANGLYGNEVPF